MPPGAKRGRSAPKSGADFKRIRRRVGHTASRRPNETNTAVSAAALHLAEQSVGRHTAAAAAEVEAMPLSRRRQTVEELGVQASHHSSQKRYDALVALKEILGARPEALARYARLFIDVPGTALSDEERDVRGAAVALLRQVLAVSDDGGSRHGGSVLLPFARHLVAYARAALASHARAVRGHALEAVGLVVKNAPSLLREPDGRAGGARGVLLLLDLSRMVQSALQAPVPGKRREGAGPLSGSHEYKATHTTKATPSAAGAAALVPIDARVGMVETMLGIISVLHTGRSSHASHALSRASLGLVAPQEGLWECSQPLFVHIPVPTISSRAYTESADGDCERVDFNALAESLVELW